MAPEQPSVELLGLSGSLRNGSSNTALLEAAAAVAPDDVELDLYEPLDALPHFDPDVEIDGPLPTSVATFRAAVARADGLVVSCPEYAHGVPGTFKNALDWLVGGEGFTDTPVALLDTSPRSTHAPAQLREIVATMSGDVVETASVTVAVSGRGLDADAIVADEELATQVRDAVAALGDAIDETSGESPGSTR